MQPASPGADVQGGENKAPISMQVRVGKNKSTKTD